MDRNQIIGLLLIAGLLLVYIEFLAPKTAKKVNTEKETAASSPTRTQPDSLVTQKQKTTLGVFAPTAAEDNQTEVSLENEDVKILFSRKGGLIKSVLLKKYKTYAQQPLYILGKENKFNEWILTKEGKINLADLYFHTYAAKETVGKNEKKEISFTLSSSSAQIIKKYTLADQGYVIESKLELKDTENLFLDHPMEFIWTNDVKPVEKDINLIRTSTTVNFYTKEKGFDNIKESSLSTQEKKIENPVQWIAMKQKYFTSAIITPSSFSNVIVKSKVTGDSTSVKELEARFSIPIDEIKNKGIAINYYFGPTDYHVMKNVTEGFSRNVYLGWTFFTSINKYLVMPIFHFLETYFSNYGLVIVFLVLIIKIILFPLSYRSYLSMAKIKALKPETDALKEKYGTDMKGMQVEQMQLYRSAGVNPLSGCIPVLLQMPILLAMLNFFPNAIEFRQESFLWARDLSTYDSIATLPFSIPGYGTHVSLFCLLMTLSTLAYTWLNNQTTSVTGPMKYMQYAMPIIFLFFLNSFPAGLTFYYFVSNLITIGQQLIIRQFVDDGEIRKKIEENKIKNKTKGKSRLQQRLEKTIKTVEENKKKK